VSGLRKEIMRVMSDLEKHRSSRRSYIILTDEEITALKARVPVSPDGTWWFDSETLVTQFYGMTVLRASDVIVSERAMREAGDDQ